MSAIGSYKRVLFKALKNIFKQKISLKILFPLLFLYYCIYIL